MLTKKERKMFALVDQWRASDYLRAEFCRLHQLKVSTFSYWVTRKNKADRETAGGFVVVESGEAASAPVPQPAQVEVVYPNGVRLRTASADSEFVRNLIRAW